MNVAMTAPPIIKPDKLLLRCPPARVNDSGTQLQGLINDRFDTLTDAEGVGLAAPQIERSRRIILARAPNDDGGGKPADDVGKLYILANPNIIRRSDDTVCGVEGCLSLPGLLGEVERHESVVLAGQNRDGRPIRLTASARLARVVQHEIDQLDGIPDINIASNVWRPTVE